jgi:hypothetical protein
MSQSSQSLGGDGDVTDTSRPGVEGRSDGRNRRSRKILIGTAISVAAIVSLVVVESQFHLIRSAMDDSGEYVTYYHTLEVSITPAETGPYVVLCPVPVNSSGVYYEGMADEIEVTAGEAVVSVVDTEHGPALRIAGEGNFSFRWIGGWRSEEGPFLRMPSMLNESYDLDANSAIPAWFFSDCEIGTVLYSLDSTVWHHFPYSVGGGTLWCWDCHPFLSDYGWQAKSIEKSGVILN